VKLKPKHWEWLSRALIFAGVVLVIVLWAYASSCDLPGSC
jgi:hypothetical protein